VSRFPHRRQFLRAAGVVFALPAFGQTKPESRHRMLAICNNLGLLAEPFFPKEAGRDYKLTPYLQPLAEHRDNLTVLSGVSHPDVDGSHSSDVCFLTAAPHPANGGFRNTISLDQVMAEQIGTETRFPSLTLGVNINRGPRSLTWTGSGVMIPCDESASLVYRKLFLQGTPGEVAQQIQRLKQGESIMDAVASHAESLKLKLGKEDQARLDQYQTGVRELERRLLLAQAWETKPKPKPSRPEPKDPDNARAYMEKVRLMYDLARLAFETDSTRLITLFLDSTNSPAIDLPGVEISDGYHNLSHHGKNESKLAQLKAIDTQHMRLLAGLLTGLKQSSLLDHTMVLYGSNFGDANKHTTTDMPILLAGGAFEHGQHLAFPGPKNHPLPNLYLSMLHRMGIETGKFASSTGPLPGLNLKRV
jgi:hypothetical protein